MDARRVILLVEHGLGGGLARHIADLASLHPGASFLTLTPVRGGLLRVGELYFDARRELDALERFLRANGVSRVHFHHTLRLPWEITGLPRALGVPYDYTAHDFYSYCPQITLTTIEFRYCGEPDEAGCNRCLAQRPASTGENIQQWRARQRAFVEGAERVFAATDGMAARLLRHFPQARVLVAPHWESSAPAAPTWTFQGTGPLRILVLGALNPLKGPDVLEASAIDAHQRRAPLEFHLLGQAYRSLRSVTVHGEYRDADLPRLMRGIAPHLAWFPAQAPETYSYTLSAAMALGLPVAATDLGAFADRLAGRALSWLLPWDTEPTAWNAFFVALRSDPASAARWAPAGKIKSPSFSYPDQYLAGEAKASAPQGGFERYRRSWRASGRFVSGYLMDTLLRHLRSVYRLPGARSLATRVLPEYRLQRLRRWLGRY